MFGRNGAQALDYWLDNSRFYGWRAPFGELPFYRSVLSQDAAFYRKRGFEVITTFACCLGEDYVGRYGLPPLIDYASLLTEAREKQGKTLLRMNDESECGAATKSCKI